MAESLWDWTLKAYALPGVPQACLTLQDRFGQNTSLLLWAIWAETEDRALLVQACEIARRWDDLALSPLRAVRRALKPACPPVADEAREGLREDVKAAELHAERVLLETLEALTPEPGGAPALAALEAASEAWGRSAPAEALAALAVALV